MKSILENTEWKYNSEDEGSVRAFYMPASVMRDSGLSCKAKIVWAYMNSRPSHWDFSAKRIAESTKEAYQAIQGAMRELEVNKYLSRKKQKNGRVSYKLETSPPKLTVEEAKQCLIEMFPDFYVQDEDFLCTNDAIEELKAEGWKDKEARKCACEWSKACAERQRGQSRHNWNKWKGHAERMKGANGG